MIKKLQHFYQAFLSPEPGGGSDDGKQRTRLAVAALLVEIALADFDSAPEEQQTILEIVRKFFDLDDAESETLLALAKSEHQASTDYFQFTRLINDHYAPAQKRSLIEGLWQVAFADGRLDRYEEHVIRRLADLLYVSHGDFIAAKHRVMAQEGLG